MTELQELAKLEAELDERATKLFKEVWHPKFKATNSKEEFKKIHSELVEEAGYPDLLPSMIEIEIIFEMDALRVRTGYFKDKEK